MTTMGSEITIRDAGPADADAVVALWQQLADQHLAYDPVRFAEVDDAADHWRKFYHETLEKDEGAVLVAVDPGDIPIGYTLVKVAEAPPVHRMRCRGEVVDLFVREDYRGRRIGASLLRKATSRLEAMGAEDVRLFVTAVNEQAIAFYRGMGMELICHQMYRRLAPVPDDVKGTGDE